MGVHPHAVPGRSAQQLVDGSAQRLAFDVPEGLVQAAETIVQHGPITPVGTGVGVLPHVLDAVDVPAFCERVQVLVYGGCDG